MFRPTRDLLINLSGSYLHTKIKDLLLVRSARRLGRPLRHGDHQGRHQRVQLRGHPQHGRQRASAPTPWSPRSTARSASPGRCRCRAPTRPAPSRSATRSPPPSPIRRRRCGACSPRPTGPLPFTVTQGVELDLSGNELPQAPNWKFSAGIQYTIRLGNGMTIVPRADYRLHRQASGRAASTSRSTGSTAMRWSTPRSSSTARTSAGSPAPSSRI